MFDKKLGPMIYHTLDTAYAKETGDWSEFFEVLASFNEGIDFFT